MDDVRAGRRFRPRMVPIRHLHPNPDQPRHRLGNLDSLVDSVRTRGILQPILIRRLGPKDFQIIAGERRYRAAVIAGISEVPCVEREAGKGESLELALVENLLRDDLSPFEEAHAYRGLIRDHGHTHASLARQVGKSRTSVTETLTLLRIPDALRAVCRTRGIRSRRQLLHVARQSDPEAMAAAVERLARGISAPGAARPRKKGSRPRPFVFRYAPRGAPFRLQLTFRRSEVKDAEVIAALRTLLEDLEASDGSAREKGQGKSPVEAGGHVGAPTDAPASRHSNS